MKEVVCVVCPRGCRIQVEVKEQDYFMTQNGCNRGPIYVRQELTDPRRSLTTTIQVHGGVEHRLPVVTNQDIPRDIVFDALELLSTVVVEAPIIVGDIIIDNILGTNVSIVAAKSLKETQNHK